MTELTARFEDALIFAFRLHKNQNRKQTRISYLSHLLAVASLVMEDGGNENEVIAALLHDAVEDQGGQATLDKIKDKFGDEVANIVLGCTDSFAKPKPPWKQRKTFYLEKLASQPAEVMRVSLADKLHNARSILSDLRIEGECVWERFNGGKEGTLWYYQQLLSIFQENFDSPHVMELSSVVDEIQRMQSDTSG